MSNTESPIVAAVGGTASSYCLRWNTFSTHLAKGLGTLLEEAEFTDVVLACDGKFVKAHKLLLSLCSPFLKRLFKTNEVNQNTIVILNNVRFHILEYIIRFVYHGEVNVHQRDLETFLKTAELLQIEGLAQPEGDGLQGLQDEESVVTFPILPDLQPAPTGIYSHATTKSVDTGSDTQVFNSAISPGQYKRAKVSSICPTPPRSRLQSLLTGQSYIPQIETPTLQAECSRNSSMFAITPHPLAGSIKEEFGEPENGIFVRSDDESIEVAEQEIYGGGQFEDTEEEQDGFQEFEHDDAMDSEKFIEHLTGTSESGSSQPQRVAVIYDLEMKEGGGPMVPSPPLPQAASNPNPLSDHHIRSLLSWRIPPPPTQQNVTLVHHELRSRDTKIEEGLGSLRDPLGIHDDDTPMIIQGSAFVDEEGKAQCPICFKFYKNRSSLKVHKSVYHRKGSFDQILLHNF